MVASAIDRRPAGRRDSKSRARGAPPAPVRSPDVIPAGQFKARCLRLMEEVRERRTEYLITKHGKPVAKLVPAEEEASDGFGSLAGSVIRHDDIVSPDQEAWNEA